MSSDLPISSKYRSTPDAPVDDRERDSLVARVNDAFEQGKLDDWTYRRALGTVFAAKTLGEGRSRTAGWVGLVSCWALLVLSVLAFPILRRRGEPLFILAAPFVLVILVSAVTYGILRFRTPADVALVVLAAQYQPLQTSRSRPRIVQESLRYF